MANPRRLCAMLASIAFLSACSFAPVYHAPQTMLPAQFKEAGGWQAAKPADRIARDGWWKAFHDPVLDRLEAQVAAANPDVAAAVARHDEAGALFDQARSGLFLTIGVGAQISSNRQSATRPLRGSNQPNVYGSNTLDAGFDYDLDLWGKVRNEVAAGRANAQASADDLASVQLSLQASLANAYFSLRGLDQQQQLLSDTIDTYQRALQLTMSRHAGGIASDLDVSRAQTQLDSARASAEDIRARRALYEHAIATLTGVPASSFSLAPDLSTGYLPTIPAGIPATLLQRRPDVAAAERRMAAANAQIGVVRAAFFPDITLGLIGGYQSSGLGHWLSAPNEIWSLGPNLALTLFDGGRRQALTDQAHAKLAENGAQYRAVVLAACQQVEDNLALTHHLGDEADREQEALDAAERTLQLSMSRYRDGVVSYLDVVTAQTTELNTKVAMLELNTRRQLASVGLIAALGGGWATDEAAGAAEAKAPVALPAHSTT
ncbi:efflux transporter outer membrane subunit [Burkholderia stabilis]|uniref:RND transporter n=1 Tax=Burkholderia stabilis TaxID=95485 RepID=A0AAJ5NHG8_9BURK|nr:efflux transporter outer membrane subunit [Burkholderia stabilis]VBB14841.1 Probable efflux pump outer membrane protein ttgC precursor,copper/silver efflux system outer membrane protein CusC,efflux transporter, outer membrane factor (OMF) lipoprotein, NodT family,Outer membrane efflux protein [Burkholderia stabilis]